jgi:predicted site-specific integrase-resolvase
VASDARVAAAEHTGTRERQTQQLAASGAARGDQVAQVVKAIGAGVHDGRPKRLALLADPGSGLRVVEHKDRLTRGGLRYVDTVLKTQGRAVAVVHQAEHGTDDLRADRSALVSSFCARRSGQRRAQRKTEVMVRELETTGDGDAPG